MNVITVPNETHHHILKICHSENEMNEKLRVVNAQITQISKESHFPLFRLSLLLPAMGFIAKKAIEDRGALDKLLGISAAIAFSLWAKARQATPKTDLDYILSMGKMGISTISFFSLSLAKLSLIANTVLMDMRSASAFDLKALAASVASLAAFVFYPLRINKSNPRDLQVQCEKLIQYKQELEKAKVVRADGLAYEFEKLLSAAMQQNVKICWKCLSDSPTMNYPKLDNASKSKVFSCFTSEKMYDMQNCMIYKQFISKRPKSFIFANSQSKSLRLPKEIVSVIVNLIKAIEESPKHRRSWEEFVQEVYV